MDYKVSFVDADGSDVNGRYYFLTIDFDKGEDRLWILYDTVDEEFYSYSLLCMSNREHADSFVYNETSTIQRTVYVYKKIDERNTHPTIKRFLNYIKEHPSKKDELVSDIKKGIVEGLL